MYLFTLRFLFMHGMYLFAGLDHWTGLLDWTTGLDYWTDLWTNFRRCTQTNLLIIHNMELSAFLVSVQRLQTTTMPTWRTAIVQTSKWPTREKHFHARRLVSYLLINNSYNVVAIDRFLVSQGNTLLLVRAKQCGLHGHWNCTYFQVADTCTLASPCGVSSRAKLPRSLA